ncbi:MAG: ribonuclease PH [Thermoanaerobaculia bacterium]
MTERIRPDGRAAREMRPILLGLDPVSHAEGSCLIEQGKTRILVTATVEEKVPPFLRDKGEGWVTAEYGMLPRATLERTPREASRGKQSGRTLEIQRLVGRALRGVVDRKLLGERTVTLDCDVLVADAGTRCASITGAFVALALAVVRLHEKKLLKRNPFREAVAAVSVGWTGGEAVLDMTYEEDSSAEVDFNIVGTSAGRFVELQGTAEGTPFGRDELRQILLAGRKGLASLFGAQGRALDGRLPTDWWKSLYGSVRGAAPRRP